MHRKQITPAVYGTSVSQGITFCGDDGLRDACCDNGRYAGTILSATQSTDTSICINTLRKQSQTAERLHISKLSVQTVWDIHLM